MTKKIFKRWSDEEIKILKENYNIPYDELQKLFPYRSVKSIKHKITNMNIPRDNEYKRYSKEEDEILKNNSHLNVSEIEKLLPNRNSLSIIQRYNYLGLEWNKTWDFWSEEEINIINSFDDIEEIVKRLPHRTTYSIQLKANRIGKLFNNYWTDEEIELLKTHYGTKYLHEIMHMFPNRKETSIYCKANQLNLKGFVGKGKYLPLNKRIRNSIEYKIWRKSIFEKDNYTCQRCGTYGGRIQAHHILSFSKHEEFRFELHNGITMCKSCHDPTVVNSFHNIYGTHNNTIEQLEEYLGYELTNARNLLNIKNANDSLHVVGQP